MRIDDTVEFLGSVPHREIGKLYSDADFLIHIPLDEPFGLVPLEAALFKKASIVADHGGPAETVKNGITGMHVDALNPGKIADAIKELMIQPDEIGRMGDAAYSWVKQNMTWEIFIDRYDEFLRQTMTVSA